MPIPTAFHSRTSELCTSMSWKEWGGYYAVCHYDSCHDPEYFAFRHAAGLIDVSPLFKYEVRGPDAARFLSRVMSKDITKLKVGRVTYLCWCDDDGKVVDDGTVSRLDEHHYRVTAAEPSLSWFGRFSRGFDVSLEDGTERIASLAIQGPSSRDVLQRVCDADLGRLRYFRVARSRLGDAEGWISRTGYTGDLGYEVWVETADAESVYDALMRAGTDYGLLPAGLDALDMARIEAGYVMNGVDYFSAHHCLTEERKNSPYELGLGFAVQLDRDPFIGQQALRRQKNEGVARSFVGLDISWPELEEVFARYGLPPELPGHAWRDGRPIYDDHGRWIGQATSGTWSPTLKKNLALAQIDTALAEEGSRVMIEVTAEYRRHRIGATIVPTPFYDPKRKRAL